MCAKLDAYCTPTFGSHHIHYHNVRSVFVGIPCAVSNFDKITSVLPPEYSGFLSH